MIKIKRVKFQKLIKFFDKNIVDEALIKSTIEHKENLQWFGMLDKRLYNAIKYIYLPNDKVYILESVDNKDIPIILVERGEKVSYISHHSENTYVKVFQSDFKDFIELVSTFV